MLRRSLTSAANNNPSSQSFKFDLTRTNNIHNNSSSSNRYDKSSVTPTAISSLQNYPTNTPDMDRSFSPISGIDIETVGESRKSSNIASAVVF